jgi:hypothetical protein
MNTERHLATVLLAALSAAAGTSALAANEALNALEYGHAPATANEARIVVQLHSSGHWQQVQNAHVAWRMRIDGSWNMTYAPDEAHYRIQFRPAGHAHEGNFHTCSDLSTCHDVKWDQAPQEQAFHRLVNIPYPAVFAGRGPAAECNALREQLLAEGKLLRHVLGSDRTIQRHASTSLSVWGENTQMRKEILVPLTIVCKGDAGIAEALDPHPASAADSLAAPFQITGAFLSILPEHKVTSACPVELSFIGRIYTTGTNGGTVQYRFEWPTGERSSVFSVDVADPAKGADVFHKFAVPLPPATLPPQGGGTGSGPATGGFAATRPTPPPNPLPEATPTAPMPGAHLEGASLPANEHKNDVRLVVLAPGSARSNSASYHIVCDPKVTPGVGGPAGMALPAPPRAPAEPPRPGVRGQAVGPAGRGPGATRQPPAAGQKPSTDLEFVPRPAIRGADRPRDRANEPLQGK